MPTHFTIGQTFTELSNPDYSVRNEEWVVTAFAYPEIAFLCTKYFVVDTAYQPYSGDEEVLGQIMRDDDQGVIIQFSQYQGMERGLQIKGTKLAYLRSIDPLRLS